MQLAAHARENHGIALALWRSPLRTEPDADGQAEDPSVREIASGERVVWGSPSSLEPAVPFGREDQLSLVLHALLLHNGFPEACLFGLLPWSADPGRAILMRLRAAGLVAPRRDRWVVPELADVPARAMLRGRDYLVDGFRGADMPDESRIAKIFQSPDVTTLLEVAAILAGAVLVIIAVQRLLPAVANRLHGRRRLNLLAATPLLRLIVIVAAVVTVVPLLIDPSLQNMVALLGALGVALGFAVKDYASALIAGVVAIGEKPYRGGDWVKIGEVYGEVRSIGMRVATVVTPDDDVVSIPHSKLWTEPVANANGGSPRHQCTADFYLHPDHDGGRVCDALTDMALTSPYLYLDEPVAVVVRETPWGTHYRVKAYPVASGQQFRFISDLTVRGKAVLRELGVEFAVVPGRPASAQVGDTSTAQS